MIFCLTLAGYSVKAYNFLRGAALNCMPTVRTLRTYRKRADSTPVFHFISLKGKHFCRTKNIEDKSLVRHKNTKEILFKHK